MQRRNLLAAAACSFAVIGLGLQAGHGEDGGYRVSGPHTHGNLAIYFVHGKSAAGRVPLSLQEAVARGAVQVHETGNVNQLHIENVGNEEVYVQSGDIVKGGKQDRVLMVSLVLPPKSGRLPIDSFCVEQGRWQARGREDVTRFASADAALPSREAKLAMKAPRRAEPVRTPDVATVAPDLEELAQGRFGRGTFGTDGRNTRIQPQRRGEPGTGSRQQEVWRSVANTQAKLAKRVGASVAAPQSASSLQLSLENDRLKEMQRDYVKALKAAGEKGDDIVGFVFAINGKINSGDIYPSNGLFRKMWTKLLDAAATEAIGEREATTGAQPTHADVLAFLQSAESGKEQAPRELTASVKLESREGDKALYFATLRSGGGWVHRNYLAK